MKPCTWYTAFISLSMILLTSALLAQDSVTIQSENGQYTGVVTHLGGATSKEDYYGTSRFQLFDTNGELLWQKEYQVAWDAFQPNFYIGSNGNVVEVDPGGDFVFYNRNGTIINRLDNYFESFQTTHANQQGAYLSIAARVGEDIYKIGLYTMEGQLQWEREVRGRSIDINSIAPGGEYVTVRGYEGHMPVYQIFGAEGALIHKFKNIEASSDNFSASGNYIVVNQKAGEQVLLIDIHKKTIIQEYNPEKLIVAADVAGDNHMILAVGDQKSRGRVNNLELLLVGFDGKEYKRIPTQTNESNKTKIKLQYDYRLNQASLIIEGKKTEYSFDPHD